MKKRASSRPLSIAGFGASSVQGFWDLEAMGFLARLQAWCWKQYPKSRVFNLGIGGNTTDAMARRAESEIKERNPDWVIVLLGCNDMPRANDDHPHIRNTIPQYKKNLKRIFAAFKGRNILFLTSFPVDPVRTGIASEQFAEYMEVAKSEALAAGAILLDVYALFKGRVREAFMHPDAVHFNAKGHSWLFEQVKKVLGPRLS